MLPDFFNYSDIISRILPLIKLLGLTLAQVADMLKHLSSSVMQVNTSDTKALKERFVSDLDEVFCPENSGENAKKFIIFNFWRRYRKFSAGHICPLAAYHKPSNMVLILDVAA